jgi:hypothetical protein
LIKKRKAEGEGLKLRRPYKKFKQKRPEEKKDMGSRSCFIKKIKYFNVKYFRRKKPGWYGNTSGLTGSALDEQE